MNLPRGIRNNNPGNIRHGSNWQGLNPNSRNIDPAFCVFTSSVYGIRALAKVLINYKKIHGLNTVRQIISRYAPPNENQTTAYIQSVAKQLGVVPDTVYADYEQDTPETIIQIDKNNAVYDEMCVNI